MVFFFEQAPSPTSGLPGTKLRPRRDPAWTSEQQWQGRVSVEVAADRAVDGIDNQGSSGLSVTAISFSGPDSENAPGRK